MFLLPLHARTSPLAVVRPIILYFSGTIPLKAVSESLPKLGNCLVDEICREITKYGFQCTPVLRQGFSGPDACSKCCKDTLLSAPMGSQDKYTPGWVWGAAHMWDPVHCNTPSTHCLICFVCVCLCVRACVCVGVALLVVLVFCVCVCAFALVCAGCLVVA